MIKRNNKGLSLVELIIAFAIFAIAGIAICSFVSFSSKELAASNKSVKLQYEQQVVVNRIRDIILETSRGIEPIADGSGLYVFSENPDYVPPTNKDEEATVDQYLITQISYLAPAEENEEGTLSIKSKTFPAGTELDAAKSSLNGITPTLITKSISDFQIINFVDNLKENKVELKMTFKVGTKEVTVNPIISLRNIISEVKDDTDLSDLYKGETIEIYSPVAKVEISRDGKIFAQSKTDTIKMAGDSTSAKYEAIVTKKKSYKGSIDTSVTWELDPTYLKDGYENYISLSNGLVTVKTVTDADGVVHQPTEYINGEYFIIKAISVQDPTKMARLRIKVTTGGIYPVSIDYVQVGPVEDRINGVAKYIFSHTITYTDGSTISGDEAYKKIKYYMADDSEVVPTGAGFTATDNVDGVFLVTKEMEEKTYHIIASVLQKNKDGEEVKCDIYLTIPKGVVPEIDDTITELILNASQKANRADYASLSVRWSNGAPLADKGNKSSVFTYNFIWTIDPVESNWGNDEINKFSDLVYFSSTNNQRYEAYNSARIAMAYIKPYLDWEKSFVFKVTVKAKIAGNYKGSYINGYYILPGTDPSDPDKMYTTDESSAYKVTALVTIDPVTLTLQPVVKTLYFNGNQHIDGYVSLDDTVYRGYKYKNGNTEYCYTKVFYPEFTGITVSPNNKWEAIPNDPKYIVNSKTNASALQIYSNYPNTGLKYYDANSNEYDYHSGIQVNEQHDNLLYFYLQMWPDKWKKYDTDKLPDGARWSCVLEDNKGNSVKAKFKTTGSDYIDYKYDYSYEEEK